MLHTQVIRSITLGVVLVACVSAATVSAECDQQVGKKRGPPPQAIEACVDSEEGAACSFAGRRGDVTGSCIVPPRDEEMLICAPERGPHQNRDEQ
jgi:hypothetical protein